MNKLLMPVFLFVAAWTAFARVQDVAMWKGETAIFRLESFAQVGGALPDGVSMRQGAVVDVDYRESPEALRWQRQCFDLYRWPEIDRALRPHHKYTVADRVSFSEGVKGVRIVEFAVSPTANAGTYMLGGVRLRIVNRTLPPIREQKAFLDLWQHPWAVSRYFNVKPFSKEHYERMRPLWKLLADYGGRTLTVTLVDEPWNHQCHDAYHSMVVKTKLADGSWEFDFTRFDEYVSFGRSCGLGPAIMCYTMCPWEYKVDWIDADGNRHREPAVPGTSFFEEYWGAFIPAFAQHLRQKGWFKDAYISMDERSREDVMNIVNFLKRKAPGLKISMAGAKAPSEMKGVEISCYSQDLCHATPELAENAAERRKKGYVTTVYACCWPPRPNTFMSSGAGEAFWLGFAPVTLGYDGFLRWAYNSWGVAPMHDMSYDSWLAGDVALVYPDAMPSWRLVELRRGLVAAEKYRILKEANEVDEALSSVVARLDVRRAILGETDFQAFEESILSLVNATDVNRRSAY